MVAGDAGVDPSLYQTVFDETGPSPVTEPLTVVPIGAGLLEVRVIQVSQNNRLLLSCKKIDFRLSCGPQNPH